MGQQAVVLVGGIVGRRAQASQVVAPQNPVLSVHGSAAWSRQEVGFLSSCFGGIAWWLRID